MSPSRPAATNEPSAAVPLPAAVLVEEQQEQQQLLQEGEGEEGW